MRLLTFILSLFLSLISGAGDKGVSVPESRPACTLSASAAPETPCGVVLNRDICLAAVQGPVFAGTGGGHAVSLRRPSQGGRRISSQTRFPFRIVKGGKVIDHNRKHPFPARPSAPGTGMSVPERYLFSICRLRL